MLYVVNGGIGLGFHHFSTCGIMNRSFQHGVGGTARNIKLTMRGKTYVLQIPSARGLPLPLNLCPYGTPSIVLPSGGMERRDFGFASNIVGNLLWRLGTP